MTQGLLQLHLGTKTGLTGCKGAQQSHHMISQAARQARQQVLEEAVVQSVLQDTQQGTQRSSTATATAQHSSSTGGAVS